MTISTNHSRGAAAGARRTSHSALHVREPLHEQVRDHLVRSLASGEWKPGEVLPNESRLADRFGVSISTVRAAIGRLVEAKVLARKQGKGTFVSLHAERRSIYQFFHVVRDDGLKQLPISEVLSLRRGQPDAESADLLRLPRKARLAEVFKIRNVLKVEGVPVVMSDIVVPCAMLPGLNARVLPGAAHPAGRVHVQRCPVRSPAQPGRHAQPLLPPGSVRSPRRLTAGRPRKERRCPTR